MKKIDNNDEQYIENDPHIKFRRKRTKSNIKLCFRFLTFIIVCSIVVITFSELTIKLKVENKLSKLMEDRVNEDAVILDYTKIVDKVSASLVTISDSKDKLDNYQKGNVTGIVIDKEGTILTNYSNIKGNKDIFVKLSSRGTKPIRGELILKHEEEDLALIKIESNEKLQPISLIKDKKILVGQDIALISNSDGKEVGSIYKGIVSSIEEKNKFGIIEISGTLSEKNIGGAVCNSNGELIGIVSKSLNSNKDIGGFLYYALDLSNLTEFLKQTDEFNKEFGIEGGLVPKDSGIGQGFYIEKIIKNGPAQKAGLKATDIIYSLDDIDITDLGDIESILQSKSSGDKIKCRVLRNGEIIDFNIEIK